MATVSKLRKGAVSSRTRGGAKLLAKGLISLGMT
jgi:hypothetical protein